MRRFVINLARRSDRKEHFLSKNGFPVEFVEAVDSRSLDAAYLIERGFYPDLTFTDPFRSRHVTWTEVACFLSHRLMWERCAELDEPIMVLEDDAVQVSEKSDAELLGILGNCDLLYLQRNENEPAGVTQFDGQIEIPAYPYNTTAYCLTPDGANKLLATDITDRIIPVDEYFSSLIRDKRIDAFAFCEDVFKPASREVLESDIESDIRRCLPVACHVFTVGTEESRCELLYRSARAHNVPVVNLGVGEAWTGGDMTGPGGGMKVNVLRRHLERIPENDIVLFVDAYDVFFGDSLENIVSRYFEMDSAIVFSAESVCWPNESLASQFPEVSLGYRFLNSGGFIGRCGALRELLASSEIGDDDDDQLFYQLIYLSEQFDIRLDSEAYIFQTHDEGVTKRGVQIFNPSTRCYGCIYHGNGGDRAKKKLATLFNAMFDSPIGLSVEGERSQVPHGPDLLVLDLFSPEQCAEIISRAEAHGGWRALEGDSFPAQEIRLVELDLFFDLVSLWTNYIVPAAEAYWKPTVMHGVRDAFVTRYTLSTQAQLALHTDASLVTGSVKLNDGYKGGVLNFPRQNWNNFHLKVGQCLLFPGQLTHGHESTPLSQGIKYSLTVWSGRFEGDSLSG